MTMDSRWVIDDSNEGFDQDIDEMLTLDPESCYDTVRNTFVDVGVVDDDIIYDTEGKPVITYTLAREVRTLPWKQVRTKYACILRWLTEARPTIQSMPFRIVINPERKCSQWQSKEVYDVTNVTDMVAYCNCLLRPEAMERLLAIKKKNGWEI